MKLKPPIAVIAIAVVCAIAVLFVIALPAYRRAREEARGTDCRNHLHQIASAKASYGIEHGTEGSVVLDLSKDLSLYIKSMEKLHCPSADRARRTPEGSYSVNAMTILPTCKIDPSNHYITWFEAGGKVRWLMPGSTPDGITRGDASIGGGEGAMDGKKVLIVGKWNALSNGEAQIVVGAVNPVIIGVTNIGTQLVPDPGRRISVAATLHWRSSLPDSNPMVRSAELGYGIDWAENEGYEWNYLKEQ